jgi:tryptophan synthase alpha chain
VIALAEGGADVIELGIPFSDPLADGPTIQASSQRALNARMTPPQVLEIVRQVRERGTQTPIILMGAWNPVLQYGPERFARDAAQVGVDGTIPDRPVARTGRRLEAGQPGRGPRHDFSARPDLDPGPHGARRQAHVRLCVSGVAHRRYRRARRRARGVADLVGAIRSHTDAPVCVGFGVSAPNTFKRSADSRTESSSAVPWWIYCTASAKTRPCWITPATSWQP